MASSPRNSSVGNGVTLSSTSSTAVPLRRRLLLKLARLETFLARFLFAHLAAALLVLVHLESKLSSRTHSFLAEDFYNNRDSSPSRRDLLVVFKSYAKNSSASLRIPRRIRIGRGRHFAPDFGNLSVASHHQRSLYHNGTQARRINAKDHAMYDRERTYRLEDIDESEEETRFTPDEDFVGGKRRSCERTNWRSERFVVCNRFHEIAYDYQIGRSSAEQEYDVVFLGRGSYRETWLFHRPEDTNNLDEVDFILKTSLYDLNFNAKVMWQVQRDAIIMEKLTASPRIVDIFGYCGFSVLSEHMVDEVEPSLLSRSSGSGYVDLEYLERKQVNDVYPMNNLTVTEKLDYAIAMAESLADLHGFEGGVILHGDSRPEQFLWSATGAMKLNDFNKGEILEFDRSKNQYCKAYRCYSDSYRSPEELLCLDSSEALDTYAMGNHIYVLLTGLWPFYEYHRKGRKSVTKAIAKKKKHPFVDKRYRTRSVIEGKLVEIMEQCWEWEQDDRVSIFDVVKQLHELKETTRG